MSEFDEGFDEGIHVDYTSNTYNGNGVGTNEPPAIALSHPRYEKNISKKKSKSVRNLIVGHMMTFMRICLM